MKSVLVLKGEEIYKNNEQKWERKYPNKIIAIDVESEGLAGFGHTLEETYENASGRYPGKQFYFRKVGPYAVTSCIPWFSLMMSPCKEYGLRVVKIKIGGPKGDKEYEAYADARMERSVIAEDEAIELGLFYVGDTVVFAGTVKEPMRLFRATVYFLKGRFTLQVLGAVLPEHAAIKVTIGKDVLG